MKEQSDLGFGMVASSFLAAADKLDGEDFSLGYEYLPICYLKRHSLELFLKSFIILLHKHYNIDFNDLPPTTDKPKYQDISGKWSDLYKEHDVAKLYQYFCSLFNANKEDIIDNTHTNDWPFGADEYLTNLQLVSNYDNHSDFFRYPMSKDAAKDKHKEIVSKVTLEEAQKITKTRKGMFLAMENRDGEITSLYSMGDSKTVENILSVLREVCYHFDCFHTALRITFFDGL